MSKFLYGIRDTEQNDLFSKINIDIEGRSGNFFISLSETNQPTNQQYENQANQNRIIQIRNNLPHRQVAGDCWTQDIKVILLRIIQNSKLVTVECNQYGKPDRVGKQKRHGWNQASYRKTWITSTEQIRWDRPTSPRAKWKIWWLNAETFAKVTRFKVTANHTPWSLMANITILAPQPNLVSFYHAAFFLKTSAPFATLIREWLSILIFNF